MSRLPVVLAAFLLALPLAADLSSVETSGLTLGRSGDEVFGGWTASASALGLTADRADLSLPSGDWGVHWPAFRLGLTAAGARPSTPFGQTFGLVGRAELPDLGLSWQTVTVTLAVPRAGGWLLGHRWEDWSAGAFSAGLQGDLLWTSDFDAGDLQADLTGGWLGWRDLGLALGAAEAKVRAAVDVLGLRVVSAEGDFRLRWAAAWWRPRWSDQGWTWGADLGGTAAWSDQGGLTIARQWAEFVTTPFWHFETRTARSSYTLEARPGWLLVFRPTVAWSGFGGWSLELSRWLPLAGGWELQEGAAQTAASSEGGAASSEADPWNLWFAGVQVSLRAQW